MESSNRNLEASARSGASASRKAETSNSRRGRLAGTPSSDTLPAMNGGNVYDEGLNYLKQPPRRNHSSSIPTYAELYGSASSNNYEEEEDEPSFMKAIRRGSLSKEESQEKLKQRLSLVSDYADNAGSIEALKERFSTNKKTLKPRPGRIARRSSISSISSAYSYGERSQQSEVTERTRSDDVSGIVSNYSMELNELGMSTPVSQKKENVFSQSAATLPVTNVIRSETDLQQQPARRRNNVQTDQIVESLVWFSFHTPRAVLEDLIAHEMDVWRKEHSMDKPSSHSKSSRRSRQRLTSGGLLSNDDESDGSLSSLSDDEKQGENYDTNFSDNMMQLQQANASSMIKLPKSVERDCALLFVDMSGFTKLSTMLDVESLSKVINSYFDMIVSEVIQHGGDILKFAGDAFFAEWKVVDTPNDKTKTATPLSELNASLVSINEMDWEDGDVPKLSSCVLQAAKCAVSIVEKFSDYHVTSMAGSTKEAMLNVHCGVGVGHIVGLHVGDYKEDQEEEGVELRREFLILGDPIDQVSKAADLATDGQVMASPEAMMALAVCCDILYAGSNQPVCIAMKEKNFLNLNSYQNGIEGGALQTYESLRMHCKALSHKALLRLHLQTALYVHPVIRGDELALSAAIQAGKISQPTETVESRHRAEAELRSVFTIFIKTIMSAKITGVPEIDQELFQKLANIMHIVSRELDRYSGHLRQFIVDDKGIVLIATFGLRGSTFPNMVSNNGLPAVFAIHRALKTEIQVESRIGATFGKVYCGVVGGVRRHEFAVMGAPVNLAARLMASKVNNGILVDEAVRSQDTDGRYEFKALPPVKAKGYSKPVPILQPTEVRAVVRKKKSSFPFTGRAEEKKAILTSAQTILDDPINSSSSMVFLMGESGMGKTALALSVIDDIRKTATVNDKTVVAARSTSTETEQRIPLSSYRKIFSSIIRDLCAFDGTVSGDLHLSGADFDSRSIGSGSGGKSLQLQSLHSLSRRGKSLGLAARIEEENEMASPRRGDSPLVRSEALSKEEWDLLETPKEETRDDCTVDTLSKSLRDIALDLATMSAPQSREKGKMALSRSLHGDHSTMKRKMKTDYLGSSVHNLTLGRAKSATPGFSPQKTLSMHGTRSMSSRPSHAARDDASMQSTDSKSHKKDTSLPYFEKLCWVCEQLDYPFEYADIVGSQFLGLDGASPITHVDGHVPTMDELVEFLALAFICLADFADLTVVLIDDFQWVDSFSWKIFRVLGNRGKKLLMLCAMRSHDKQAMRRLSTAATRQSELNNLTVEISLLPLDVPDIKVLMSRVLGYTKKKIPESLCVDVFQRSGGLPVYVVQMLEDMKRRNTVEIGENGVLEWTELGLKEKRNAASNSSGAVMEETFLSRFDGLDVRVRKTLQTCAVLGLSFALSDVIQVHPEMEEFDIEDAIDSAVDEMILVEQIEDNDLDDTSSKSSKSSNSDASESEVSDSHTQTFTFDRTANSDNMAPINDRYFQFSHAMWRKNVLTTMLKERKVELHRLIAESMEKNQILNVEESDISRLLTLFEHWKSCGDFSKSAPLAILVGSRLEDWDLSAQSLELYEDALQMSFESVTTTEETDSEWISVSAKPQVLDLILRLHVRVGLCHRRLGDEAESLAAFEDAYRITKTASKIPSASRELMMPILSSLCVLKTSQPVSDPHTRAKLENLLEKFVEEAKKNKKPVYVGRSMSMQAAFFVKNGKMEKAVRICEKMCQSYNVAKYSGDMVAEYGQDTVIECLAESVQWYYLIDKHAEAEEQADVIIERYLPLVDSTDTDACMRVVLPIIQVLRLVNRAKDADWLLKRYIINPAHDQAANSEFWIPIFNPLAYVIELIIMEEAEEYDALTLKDLEEWILNDENSDFDYELERKAHTLMGEICWRLANFHDDDSKTREELEKKGKSLLMPVAQYPHDEVFLRRTAIAIMEAF